MTVADHLRHWKTAHTAASTARRNRVLTLNADYLIEAQQALSDAADIDPDLHDPAWLTIPPLRSLHEFYADQLDADRPRAPRFTVISPEKEQQAMAAMKKRVTEKPDTKPDIEVRH